MKSHVSCSETAYTQGQNGVELSGQGGVQACMVLRMSGKWVGRWRVWQYPVPLVIEASSVYYTLEYLGIQPKFKDVAEIHI